MNLKSEDIELLRTMYEGNPKDLYYYYENFSILPYQLSKVIKKYELKEIIKLEGTKVFLTQNGKQWIYLNRRKIFLKKQEMKWKEVPKDMKENQEDTQNLYKPLRKNIDQEIFEYLEEED